MTQLSKMNWRRLEETSNEKQGLQDRSIRQRGEELYVGGIGRLEIVVGKWKQRPLP